MGSSESCYKCLFWKVCIRSDNIPLSGLCLVDGDKKETPATHCLQEACVRFRPNP